MAASASVDHSPKWLRYWNVNMDLNGTFSIGLAQASCFLKLLSVDYIASSDFISQNVAGGLLGPTPCTADARELHAFLVLDICAFSPPSSALGQRGPVVLFPGTWLRGGALMWLRSVRLEGDANGRGKKAGDPDRQG